MDYVDSAVSSGGRFLKDVYKDVLSPAGRSLEKVTSEDVIDPAVRKLKSIIGPRWGEFRRFGRKAKNYVIKGLTGLDRLSSDAYNTARRLYNSSGAIGEDLSKAYRGVSGNLGSFANRYKNYSHNTLESARNILNKHIRDNAENFSELGSDLQGTLDNMWGSIGNRVSGGLQKSSSLQKEALFGFLGRAAARRTMANARKMLPRARATRTRSYNRAAEEYNRKLNPAGTVKEPTPEGIPNMSYNGPTNATFNDVPNMSMTATTPPTVTAATGTAGAATSAAVPGNIINNNIQLAGGIPAGAAGAAGAVPAATSSLGSKIGTGMNVLTMGMMGYGMLGGGGSAAAQAAPAAEAAMVAANPRMYMPQTSYANWAANNNILRGLYM